MIIMPRNLILIDLGEKQESKVVIPDEIKERYEEEKLHNLGEGTVIAVGEDCKYFKVGDTVNYPGYIGNLVHCADYKDRITTVVAENDIIFGFRK